MEGVYWAVRSQVLSKSICELIRSLACTYVFLQQRNFGYQLSYLKSFFPSISGAFAKLRKASICFVMYVRPPVPTGWIFMKFDILVFFVKLSKNQVSLKSDKNNGYFT